MAKALGLSILAWGPLAGGVLSGKYSLQGDEVHISDSKRGDWLNSERITREALGIADMVVQVATELGCPPPQVALAWIRRQMDGIVPIICGRTADQIQQNLGCLDLAIEDAQFERLNEISRVDMGFPHRFLSSKALREALFGNKLGLLQSKNRSEFDVQKSRTQFDVPKPKMESPHDSRHSHD
jgi:diketogulonate reductase-like aldo/keto reductase